MIPLPNFNNGDVLDADTFNLLSRFIFYHILVKLYYYGFPPSTDVLLFHEYCLIPEIEKSNSYKYKLYLFFYNLNNEEIINSFEVEVNGNSLGAIPFDVSKSLYVLDLDPSILSFDQSNEIKIYFHLDGARHIRIRMEGYLLIYY